MIGMVLLIILLVVVVVAVIIGVVIWAAIVSSSSTTTSSSSAGTPAFPTNGKTYSIANIGYPGITPGLSGPMGNATDQWTMVLVATGPAPIYEQTFRIVNYTDSTKALTATSSTTVAFTTAPSTTDTTQQWILTYNTGTAALGTYVLTNYNYTTSLYTDGTVMALGTGGASLNNYLWQFTAQ